MTEVIAFSGVHNTGKSTCIEKVRDELIKQNKAVLVLEEIARLFFLPQRNNPDKMQTSINKVENAKLDYLIALTKLQVFDVILVDRTFKDHIAYSKYYQSQGQMDQKSELQDRAECPYDKIIFFQEGIRDSKYWDPSADKALSAILLSENEKYPIAPELFANFKTDEEAVMNSLTQKTNS